MALCTVFLTVTTSNRVHVSFSPGNEQQQARCLFAVRMSCTDDIVPQFNEWYALMLQ